jgi:hypothetical protein
LTHVSLVQCTSSLFSLLHLYLNIFISYENVTVVKTFKKISTHKTSSITVTLACQADLNFTVSYTYHDMQVHYYSNQKCFRLLSDVNTCIYILFCRKAEQIYIRCIEHVHTSRNYNTSGSCTINPTETYRKQFADHIF